MQATEITSTILGQSNSRENKFLFYFVVVENLTLIYLLQGQKATAEPINISKYVPDFSLFKMG